jgi:glycosyltransferase involved in cell wall biosynthesis
LAKLIFIDYAIEITKPDLIHFHGTTGALFSTGLWNKKLKKVLRMHGINGYNPSIPFFKLHEKIEKYITGLSFEKVTFVAVSICEEWKEKFGSFQCEMIPILNGYNQNLFHTLKSTESKAKKFDLITFSGVSENKGQSRVIEAICNLKRQKLDLSYLVIGSGEKEYLNSIKKFVTENKLNVTFIDYLPQEELIKYLQHSKFFILPSITEGFGKVYVESIGAGVPVIIPQHLPLTKEKGVLNEENAVLITDYSVESIEEGLKKIFSSDIIYSNIKVSSSVEALQWKNLAKEYLEIYEHIFMSI